MAQLLNELVSGAGVEDVLLDGNVLIIELVEQAEWRRIFDIVIEALLTEFLRDML